MKKIITVLSAAALLSACTSTPADNWQQHTTPKANGNYTAEARGTSATEARQNTLMVARAACSAENGRLAVVSEDATYDGPTGFAGTAAKLGELGALVYAKNTGTSLYTVPDEHHQHSLDFRCDN